MKHIIGLSIMLISGVFASNAWDAGDSSLRSPDRLTPTSLSPQVEPEFVAPLKDDANRAAEEELLRPTRYNNGQHKKIRKHTVMFSQPHPSTNTQWGTEIDDEQQEDYTSLDGNDIQELDNTSQLYTVHHLATFNPSVYLLAAELVPEN